VAGVIVVFGVLLTGQTPFYLTHQRLSVRGKDFTVERAVTDWQRQRGLMYRSHLAPDRGMLLAYSTVGRYGIWMHNMRLSIDALWIAADGTIIDLVQGLRPELDAHTSTVPAMGILELPAGTVEQLGIVVGDRVDWR